MNYGSGESLEPLAPLIMAPLVPRMHLFEIDDQTWFPSTLRTLVQNTLTQTWCMKFPFQHTSPAEKAALLLIRELGSLISTSTFVDFCAGAGGPTPFIERTVNENLRHQALHEVDFVLSDIHPNVEAWSRIAHSSKHITFEPQSVDASRAPDHLVRRDNGRNIIRLFNLAFHHFDDHLAREILRDTITASQGFAIFELQDRGLMSLIADLLLPIGVVLAAPFYAWKLRLPTLFLFTWIIPILPLVLVWDGIVSSLRTREPEEVEALLRSCGASTGEWEMRSGRERFLWPCGHLNWIICKPVRSGYR